MNATAKTAAASVISALLLASCGQNAQEASEAYKTCVSAGMAAYTDSTGDVRCQTPEDVAKAGQSFERYYKERSQCEKEGNVYVIGYRWMQYCDATVTKKWKIP